MQRRGNHLVRRRLVAVGLFKGAVLRQPLKRANRMRRDPEGLPDAAVEALAGGCDTPAFVRLAGMEGSGWSEIEPVVRRVFEERERELPWADEA